MKVVLTFIVCFAVIMVINQTGYGSCYSSYCLGAAVPKVAIFSVIATAVIAYLSKK